jgi:hypothetical protein
VKGYPVTRDELFTLAGVGLLSSACFGVGVNFIDRSIDLMADLEINQGIPQEIMVRWATREYDYWYFGLVLVAIGIAAAIAGGIKILSIIRSTEHPNG